MVVSVDGRGVDGPLTDMRQVEAMSRGLCSGDAAEVTVLRDGTEVELPLEGIELSAEGIDRVVSFAGLIAHDPHVDVAIQEQESPRGVYLTWLWYGSPAYRYGLRPTRQVLEVDGVATPTLDAFLDAIDGLEDGESVRLSMRDRQGRETVETIRVDLHYWPTQLFELQDDGKTYKKVAWRGPLIEQRREELSVEIGNAEGITAHSTFEAWQIASSLWKMITPRFEGGTPSFMLLDERAFSLDKKSSIPFNLYWTLINRAYISKLDSSGRLQITLKTLYKWSGLEGRFQRVSKLRELFRDALEKMVLQNLIASWSCPALTSRKRRRLDELLDEPLEVIFSLTQLESLGHLVPESLLGDGSPGHHNLLP